MPPPEMAADPEANAAEPSSENKDPSPTLPVKAEQPLPTASPEKSGRASVSPEKSVGTAELAPEDMGRPEMKEQNAADSVMKDPAVSSSSEKKDLSTSSPGKSEGVPAETKDPVSASPEKSEKIPPGSESSERRGRSSASPTKSESSPEKRCQFDDKGKAVVVDADEVMSAAGVGVPSVLDNVDTDALDSSPETRYRSDYKRKEVVVESNEGTRLAATISVGNIVSDFIAQFPRREVSWEDFDPYGEVENPTTQVDPKTPVVGDMESLSALAAEYETGSSLFKENIKLLGDQYSAFRRTRRDGNCFYRAFIFAYLEYIFESKDEKEVARIKKCAEQCKTTLRNMQYDPFDYENNFEAFCEDLDYVIQGSLSHEELLIYLQDETTSDILVKCLRLATAADIMNRPEFFRPFLDKGIEQICISNVLTMEQEVEEWHITALCNALGVPFCVVYLDRNPSKHGAALNHYVRLPLPSTGSASTSVDKKSAETQRPLFALLYRPGHYDILYTKN